MSLAALVKSRVTARATGALVTPLIDGHLLLTPMSEDRRDKKFHPSDLAGRFCPRAWALYNYHPDGYRIKENAIDPRTARIFGNGHGVHERIQGYLGKYLWGRWVTPEWTKVRVYDGYRPDGVGPWTYDEVKLRHDLDRIVGSTDGLLNIGGKKYGLEVKSINSEGFKWLTDGPKEFHKNQTLIYMHCLENERQGLLAISPNPTIDPFELEPLQGFVVLYENKDTQELKEFFVPYDEQEVAQFMTSRRKLMTAALEYETTGEWPICRCVPGKESALCKAVPEA